jgi:hypothetical protein
MNAVILTDRGDRISVDLEDFSLRQDGEVILNQLRGTTYLPIPCEEIGNDFLRCETKDGKFFCWLHVISQYEVVSNGPYDLL